MDRDVCGITLEHMTKGLTHCYIGYNRLSVPPIPQYSHIVLHLIQTQSLEARKISRHARKRKMRMFDKTTIPYKPTGIVLKLR